MYMEKSNERKSSVLAQCIACLLCISMPVMAGNLVVRDSIKCGDADFGPYLADIGRRFHKLWRMPAGRRKKSVAVIFRLDQDGNISRVRIDKSSSDPVVDKAAIQVVKTANLRSLPVGSTKTVDIRFVFDKQFQDDQECYWQKVQLLD